MEYSIIELIVTELKKIVNLYVGYYPYDFQYIQNKLPALLVKLNNTTVLPLGHHKYDVNCNTLFILYSNQSFSALLALELTIIDTIVSELHNISGLCIIDIGNTDVLTGDINLYTLPSLSGYNANIIVRKLNQNYTFRKTI